MSTLRDCRPGCLGRGALAAWRREWFVSQGWRGCPYCVKPVRWTP